MDPSPTRREEQLSKMKTRLDDYDYIRFTIVDIGGRPRTKLVPARNAYEFFESGIPFYSGITGIPSDDELVLPPELEVGKYGNITMMADLDTFHPVPWVGRNKYKTAEVFVEPGDESEFDRTIRHTCPRFLAREQLRRLEELGYVLKSGMEWEYLLLHKDSQEPIISKWVDFHSPILLTEYDHWFTDIDKYLAEAGVNVHTMQTEFVCSQFEFNSAPAYGIWGADGNVIMKQCIKEVASLKGWSANFMAKLSHEDDMGSGAHFSFSVWDKASGANAFYDEAEPENLSKMARCWIAGVVKHAPALTALCCPTTNCYWRIPDGWTPSAGDWGIEDRMALLRVKNKGVKGTYMENRLPSPLANPFLLLAGVVAAGLDGVKNQLPCPGPRPQTQATALPKSLEKALVCLEEDEVMVEALGKTFVEWFTLTKREADIKALQGVEKDSERIEVERRRYGRTC